MARSSASTPQSSPLPGAAAAFILLALVAVMAYWGGVPQRGLGLFALGVAVLLALLAAFGYLSWRLLFAPQRALATAAPALSATQQRLVAVLLALCGLGIVVGGAWDAAWHGQFGIPFGEDLLWRPHLMMYASLGLVSTLAFASLFYLVKRGRGSAAARFRAQPALGLLVLLGALLVFVTPMDPLWHLLYGADISAWSLPHLVLAVSFAAIMLTAVALYAATLPLDARVGWGHAAFMLGVLAAALDMLLLLLIVEWDMIRAVPARPFGVFWARPEWLLPVMIVGLSSFFGTLALALVRRAGSAVLLGLAGLGLRALLAAAFGFASVKAWLLVLPPLVALELGAWTSRRLRGREPSLLASAGAAILGLALGTLPLIHMLYPYPRVQLALIVPALAIGALLALYGCWLGRRLGAALRAQPRNLPQAGERQRPWLVPLALGGMLAFLVLFIVTATPPL